MSSLRVFRQRAGRLTAVFALLAASVVPAFVPGLALAAQITDRSIALSDATVKASNVTYAVTLTPATSAGALVIEFCANSPTIGDVCTAPDATFNAASAATSGGFTVESGATANKLVVSGTYPTSTTTVTLTNITNPATAGPLYARLVTYTDATAAASYTSTAPGTHIDDGGVAMNITPTISVSGTVQESMLFCVANATITADCGDAGTHLPTLKLGEPVGDSVALIPSAISTGLLYTQISTNAASGAVINLKSNTTCGGLQRAGTNTCEIAPTNTGNTGITAGQARFGVKTATATGTAGTLEAVSGSLYNDSAYAFNYVSGGASGVTSTYGDPFLDTAGAPANNMNMTLTFGASVANNTPAGNYSTNLSMIATGKF